MAFTTATAPREIGFFENLGLTFEKMMARIGPAMEIYARQEQIAALEAKSDEELARLGIQRDLIAYHVFRDRFYI